MSGMESAFSWHPGWRASNLAREPHDVSGRSITVHMTHVTLRAATLGASLALLALAQACVRAPGANPSPSMLRADSPGLAEFESRRGRSNGHFLTADLLEEHDNLPLADVL